MHGQQNMTLNSKH